MTGILTVSGTRMKQNTNFVENLRHLGYLTAQSSEITVMFTGIKLLLGSVKNRVGPHLFDQATSAP